MCCHLLVPIFDSEEAHFVQKKPNRDDFFKTVETRLKFTLKSLYFWNRVSTVLQKSSRLDFFLKFSESSLDGFAKSRHGLIFFEQMNFFRVKNGDQKNGNTLWATTFFRVVRSGYRLKIWTVHIHTRDHASAFLRSRPGKQSCGLFLVCARYVSDQATRTSNFSPPAASRYSAARRLEEMSSTSLSSCGRVIGEPWKSKILMKGLSSGNGQLQLSPPLSSSTCIYTRPKNPWTTAPIGLPFQLRKH